MNKLSELLTKKYLAWQGSMGQRKTLEEFADYLNVSRPLLSFWMNGKRIPSEENLEKIASLLGDEIYDALDLPRPNPHLKRISKLWEFIPEEIQKQIVNEAEKYDDHNDANKLRKASKPRKTKQTL
jgi:transcriptional regulator with XRE-family HTH domain